MAEVVATLTVLGDVGEGAEVIRVLGRTGDVPDLMLGYYCLVRGQKNRLELRSNRNKSIDQ
jgi:ribosomal protein S28E/S33